MSIQNMFFWAFSLVPMKVYCYCCHLFSSVDIHQLVWRALIYNFHLHHAFLFFVCCYILFCQQSCGIAEISTTLIKTNDLNLDGLILIWIFWLGNWALVMNGRELSKKRNPPLYHKWLAWLEKKNGDIFNVKISIYKCFRGVCFVM